MHDKISFMIGDDDYLFEFEYHPPQKQDKFDPGESESIELLSVVENGIELNHEEQIDFERKHMDSLQGKIINIIFRRGSYATA